MKRQPQFAGLQGQGADYWDPAKPMELRVLYYGQISGWAYRWEGPTTVWRAATPIPGFTVQLSPPVVSLWEGQQVPVTATITVALDVARGPHRIWFAAVDPWENGVKYTST